MADFDQGWDKAIEVRDFTLIKLREILAMECNELQAPAWLQGADFITEFEQVLTPIANEVLDVLESIVKQWDEESAQRWSSQFEEYDKAMNRLLVESGKIIAEQLVSDDGGTTWHTKNA